jgi:hypothetical protein
MQQVIGPTIIIGHPGLPLRTQEVTRLVKCVL